MENKTTHDYDYNGVFKPGIVLTSLVTMCITIIGLPALAVGIYLLV